MSAPNPAIQPEKDGPWRWTYGLWVVIGGFLAVLIAFGISVVVVHNKGSVPGMFAGVTGVIGTLAGAYFGNQSGQAGRQKTEQKRDEAEEKLRQLAAAAPPEIARSIVGPSTQP